MTLYKVKKTCIELTMIINNKSYRKDCVTYAMFIRMFVITIIHVWTFIWVWNCEVQPLQNSELLGYTKYVDVWCTWACEYWPIASKDSKLFMIFYGRPCIFITRNQGNGDDPQAYSLRAFSSCIWNQQVTYGFRKRYVKCVVMFLVMLFTREGKAEIWRSTIFKFAWKWV